MIQRVIYRQRLRARMGHASERAAPPESTRLKALTGRLRNAIDTHVQAEQARLNEDDGGAAG